MHWGPHYCSLSSEEDHGGYTSSPATRSSCSSSNSTSSLCSDSASDDGTIDYRPFVCTYPGCTSRFRRKYTLKDHMNAHTGQKSFVCPVSTCGKSFTTSGNFARHRRLHPWLDEPRQCLVDGCKCVFPNDEKLQRHMLSHFDDSINYRCDIGTCGRVFTTTGNLHRHIKQRHSDTPEAERLRMKPRPRRCTLATKTTLNQRHSLVVGAVPSPLPYPVGMTDQLPFDQELLDALVCLFGEDGI